MQSTLHRLPYDKRGWSSGAFVGRDGVDALRARLRTRVLPWGLLADVLTQSFLVSAHSRELPLAKTAVASRRPSDAFDRTIATNYALCKRLQRAHLVPSGPDTDADHRVLVHLTPRENGHLLAVFLAHVHVHLDHRSGLEPRGVPQLLFGCTPAALNRLHAVAHWLDIFNTRIPQAVFRQPPAGRPAGRRLAATRWSTSACLCTTSRCRSGTPRSAAARRPSPPARGCRRRTTLPAVSPRAPPRGQG